MADTGTAKIFMHGGGQAVRLPKAFRLWYRIKKSQRPVESAANLSGFFSLDVALWPFEQEDAEEAGDIRAALERLGTPIGPYDVLIPAQAPRCGAPLVSADEREFARAPGLRSEERMA